MNTFLPLVLVLTLAAGFYALIPWTALTSWTTETQRLFQNYTARALSALRTGDMSAIWALCGATAFYGFVHALGPGHGKILLGGAALATGSTFRRMAALTVISSLAQSGTAIFLVGILAVVSGVSAQTLGPIADDLLAPASYAAIAALGFYLIWRSLGCWRTPAGSQDHGHHHSHDHGHCGACCVHAHGPSVQEFESLGSVQDAVMLVASIALRPCTGAIFVLVIALRFDVFWVGCLSVVTMGLGTASFNLLVSASGVAAKRFSTAGAGTEANLARVSAMVQFFGGTLIVLFSCLWLARFWL